MASLAVLALAGAACGASHSGSAPASRHGAGWPSPKVGARSERLFPVLVAAASPRVVYVLGRAAGMVRPGLFRRDDAGRHFHQVRSPGARSTRTGRSAPVRELWFAGPSDGYALFSSWGQRGPLLVTSDGARTWHRSAVGGRGFVTAVAGHGRWVYALALRCLRGLTACPAAALYQSAAGSLTWARVSAAGLAQVNEAGGPSLAAWGRSVWIMAGNGEIGSPVLAWSGDGGRSVRQEAVPAVGCGLTATSPAVAWLTCSGGMMLTFDRWSTGRLMRLPVTGSGTGNTFLDPVSDTSAWFGTGAGNAAGLYLTRDAGTRFTKIGRLPPAFRSGTAATMLFLNPRTGLSWACGGPLQRTTNGGRSWTLARL
jgi:hypothetical protein